MSAAARELYVYYKLPAARAAGALAAFERARGDAPVRLLQRPDAGGPELTWMEIYAAGPADRAALEARIAVAMAPFAVGGRHVELFQALA